VAGKGSCCLRCPGPGALALRQRRRKPGRL